MKYAVIIALIFATFALSVGCSKQPATVDASSDQTFKASIEAITYGMTESARQELAKAAMLVALQGVNLMEETPEDAFAKLDGMTADEILNKAEALKKEAERIAAERKAVQRAAHIARQEKRLQEIDKAMQEAEIARAVLEKFKINKAHFSWKKDSFSLQPAISLDIRNNTGQPVSRFYASAVLKSPGREIPWLDETFNYVFKGGIEDGESWSGSLLPNQFGEWGNAPKDRTDLILEIEVYKIEGADEKVIAELKGLNFQKEIDAIMAEIQALNYSSDL